MNIKKKIYTKVMTIKTAPDLFDKFKEAVGEGNISKKIRELMKNCIKEEKKERLVE